MPTLAQTLHGYDQGHRLLASGGDLNERELALLDRLSDLSGYLPTGTHFDRYHSGFPCGRYYALACTWTDRAATRSGTVLTHTLLLPRGDARGLEDLWGLTLLHRPPRGAGDREAYREPLSVPELPSAPQEPLSPPEAAAAVLLLLGTTDRPILWVDERQSDAVVRFLWSLLRAEQREDFAFCTFALQPRSVEGRSFDFLGLPPTARGSFLERASSEAWWDSGRLLHPRLAGLLQKDWVTELARQGAPLLRRLEASCQNLGLSLPAAKDFATLWRFMDLEPAAAERLAAARARADLFERLWPGLEPTHPATAPILRALLDRQADAALEPRPLWELTDFLKRPMVRGRLGADTGFAAKVEQVLVRELERRFEQVPARTAQELPELLEASGTRWSDSLLSILQRVLAVAPDAAVRLAPPLLRKAADSRWPKLVDTTLASLPAPERQRALDEALHEAAAPTREELLRLAEETADRIEDPRLLLSIGKRRGRVLEALHAIARRGVAQDARPPEEKLGPLLAEVEASTRLAWALEVREPPRLAWYAAEVGAEAARELALPPDELVRQCGGTPNGARLLLLFAEKAHHVEPLVQALRQTPALALDLLVLALREEGPRIERLTRVAAELIPTEQLLAPELRRALLATRESWRIRELVERLGPQWSRAVCEQSLAPAELASWLDIPSMRQWLQYAWRDQLLSAAKGVDENLLLPGLAAVLHAWLDSTDTHDREWIHRLLERLLRNTSARELNLASEHLAHVLRRVPVWVLDNSYLPNDLLALVHRTRPISGWHIVEQVFPRLYARVCREGKSFSATLLSFFTGKDWDKAKPMRQWLVDTYIELNWPPDSFLRCLDGDTALFFRLAHRAARSREGMDFLQRLPAALERAPELAARWRRPIEEVLANPHRPIDFE
ncbi:hypothetical protein [Archangium sp.]|uniref:GAP1-N1 domain-containing protein n=1 Tax=Archangium sp. TaxID=1872627 RepID=UPI00286C6F98|nr:hypothetical protein [Archangium sp.]